MAIINASFSQQITWGKGDQGYKFRTVITYQSKQKASRLFNRVEYNGDQQFAMYCFRLKTTWGEGGKFRRSVRVG